MLLQPMQEKLVPLARLFVIRLARTGGKDARSAVDFAKYDVERAEYRREISEHVSASQEIHCRQL